MQLRSLEQIPAASAGRWGHAAVRDLRAPAQHAMLTEASGRRTQVGRPGLDVNRLRELAPEELPQGPQLTRALRSDKARPRGAPRWGSPDSTSPDSANWRPKNLLWCVWPWKPEIMPLSCSSRCLRGPAQQQHTHLRSAGVRHSTGNHTPVWVPPSSQPSSRTLACAAGGHRARAGHTAALLVVRARLSARAASAMLLPGFGLSRDPWTQTGGGAHPKTVLG